MKTSREWLFELPTDATRVAVNAYVDAYEFQRQEGLDEHDARTAADEAFKDALASTMPPEPVTTGYCPTCGKPMTAAEGPL